MRYIGCHLSSSAGFAAMGRTALSIGANTFQFFTRNPRGSRAKALDPADAAALRELLGSTAPYAPPDLPFYTSEGSVLDVPPLKAP